MITIYKYPIPDAINSIDLPLGSQIMKADFDPTGQLCIWACVDTEADTENIKIWKIGTGWPLNDMLEKYKVSYIDSVNEGPYVWHIFKLEDKYFFQATNAYEAMAHG